MAQLIISNMTGAEVAKAQDPKEAESLIRQQLHTLKCQSSEIEEKVRDSLNQPPSVITMDFESVSRQVRP